MRLVYLGSPEAAVEPLHALVTSGHDILLVVTQPDRKRGRGAALLPSPVKAAALELDLAVTDQVNDIPQVVADGAELGVVVAFGQLIRKPVLDILPFINLHFSLLPRWRGAAPVERALLAGDAETGVCLMGLEAGLDTGPVYDRVTTEILASDDLATLRARLVGVGTEMLIRRLSGGFATLGTPQPQHGESTYAAKLDPSEFEIDWSSSAEVISRLVRLGYAWTTFRGKRFKILVAHVVKVVQGHVEPDVVGGVGSLQLANGVRVCTGDGHLELLRVQPEGKSAMDIQSWRNGAKPTETDVMGR